MSLIFGALTQDFVDFSITRARADAGDPDGIAKLPEAAAHFRHASAMDASYLVYIGISLYLINLRRDLNNFIRCRHVRREFHLHDDLGPHFGSWRKTSP